MSCSKGAWRGGPFLNYIFEPLFGTLTALLPPTPPPIPLKRLDLQYLKALSGTPSYTSKVDRPSLPKGIFRTPSYYTPKGTPQHFQHLKALSGTGEAKLTGKLRNGFAISSGQQSLFFYTSAGCILFWCQAAILDNQFAHSADLICADAWEHSASFQPFDSDSHHMFSLMSEFVSRVPKKRESSRNRGDTK